MSLTDTMTDADVERMVRERDEAQAAADAWKRRCEELEAVRKDKLNKEQSDG